ncbi:MAG: YIP1 family protein [Candidatus Aenigmatarchaeota archaeon]|nr:MAG: YIP1 family protein [Candidatus Aenigmarchaeota archaeon]
MVGRMWWKVKASLMEPSKMFNTVSKERGLGEPVKYLAVVSLVSSFLASVLAFPGDVAMISLVFAAFYAMTVAGSFFVALLTHACSMLLGGKGTYEATYKATAYAYTPSALFGWIPVAGFLAHAYGLYVYAKGISRLHKVTMGKAVAIVVVPLVLVYIVFVVFLAVLLLAYAPYLNAGGLQPGFTGLV